MFELSDRLAAIQPFHVMRLLRRSKELEQQGRDIVHMEIGEPDFPTPERITGAAIDALKHRDIKYTVAQGLPELRQAIADYYRFRYGVGITANRIFITPGGSGALLLACAAVVRRESRVLMADPCYPCNRNMIRLFDGDPVLIPVGADCRYQLQLDLVRSHWTEKTQGVLVASPSNPTGTIIDAEQFRSLIGFVETHDGFVISDEIYHGLHYERGVASALEYSSNVFVANSFSKYFGMTGWRIGWLIVPESTIPEVEKLAQNMFISAPTHSQWAALAAFADETRDELERRRSAFRQRRDLVVDQLQDIGFKIPVQPDGAFYVYAACDELSSNSFEMADRLLENHGVAITPGMDFGRHQPERHIRIAYTTTMDRLQEGMDRIRAAVRLG